MEVSLSSPSRNVDIPILMVQLKPLLTYRLTYRIAMCYLGTQFFDSETQHGFSGFSLALLNAPCTKGLTSHLHWHYQICHLQSANGGHNRWACGCVALDLHL